jgi:hypothetical protein
MGYEENGAVYGRNFGLIHAFLDTAPPTIPEPGRVPPGVAIGECECPQLHW